MNEPNSPAALLVSTDGRRWVRPSQPNQSGTPTALGYVAGRFIAGGSGGEVRYSNQLFPDNTAPVASPVAFPTTVPVRQPVSFTATATDADGHPLLFAWDFGVQQGIEDGPNATATFAFGGTYAATLRVIDGWGGMTTTNRTITISDPARSWTKRTTSTGATLRSVAASPSLLVAVGDWGTVLTSPDGAIWTPRTINPETPNRGLKAVTWDGVRFVASGNEYDFSVPGWTAAVFSSPDGISWSRVYKSNTAAASTLHSVCSYGQISLAVGDNGLVVKSAGDNIWTPVTFPITGASLTGVTSSNNGFVAVVGATGTAKVFTSPNGSSGTWVDQSVGAGLDNWQYFEKIDWQVDRLVASGWHSRFQYSTDGGMSFVGTRPSTERLPATAAGDGIRFAAGEDLDSIQQVNLYSLDGNRWYSFSPPTSTARNGATFYHHTIVTVGDNGEIWQSGQVSASNWQSWLATYFPGGASAAQLGQDPDGDGVPNRLEYALGRDPRIAKAGDGALALPQMVALAGRQVLRATIPDPAPADAIYAIQGTSNLETGGWTTLARKSGTAAWQWLGGGLPQITTGTPIDGRVTVDVGAPDSASGAARYFLRLVLEAP
jgi:hypothetical protein